MRNKDLLTQRKTEIISQMNQAIANDDEKAFGEAFEKLCNTIQDNVLEEARELIGQQDTTVLAQRGVRQLTSKEKQFYEKVIDAMKSTNPKQALNDVDVVMPETIINSVFEDLKTNHPLLGAVDAQNVNGLVRMLLNTNTEQQAIWGKLCSAIVEEISSGFKEVNMAQNKLSAFIPVCKDMLDLGPAWLDRYVREILTEAYANGLEYGIVLGTGKNEPIGMMRQVGEGVTVTDGVYPLKESIKITAMDMEQMGNVTAIMARNANGAARTVKGLIMVVNPVDYWKKFRPATMMLTPNGVYTSILPVPAEIYQSAAVPEGKLVYGMGKRYFMGFGTAKNGKIEYSDEYRFLEDDRVYIIKGHANGFAKDNNSFVVLDIDALQPVRYKVVQIDENHTENANLVSLVVGTSVLTPPFAQETTVYTATTENATDAVTGIPASASAEVKLAVNGVTVANGSAVKWNDGQNAVSITVTDGATTKAYTVTVTKE